MGSGCREKRGEERRVLFDQQDEVGSGSFQEVLGGQVGGGG